MATTGIIQGRLNKVLISSVALDDQMDSDLSITLETDDVTTKLSTSQWREFLPSYKSATGSCNILISYDATEGIKQAFADITAGTTITVLFSTEVTGDVTYSASALLTTWNPSWPMSGPSTLAFSYQITGVITEGTS